MFRLNSTSLLISAAAAFVGLSISGALHPAQAQSAEGPWAGGFTPADDSQCRRLQPGREAPLRINVRDGRATFIFGPPHQPVEAVGSIKDDGRVRASGELPGIGAPVEFRGRFAGGTFSGRFEFGRAGRCTGIVRASAGGQPARPNFARSGSQGRFLAPEGRPGGQFQPRQSARQSPEQLAQERAAREKAEKEAAEMKERLARLEAAQQQQQRIVTRSLQSGAQPSGASVEEQLAALKRLKDGGLITEDQYKARQQAVLDRNFGGGDPASSDAAATPRAETAFDVPAGIKFGDYHALVIGINNYKNLNKLANAEADARAVAKVLEENYDFKVTLLIDPNREDIIDTLDDLRATLKFKDNLLVYYAGHGWLDEDADQGFWLPANAKPNRRSAWVSNGIITGTLKAMEAKHVMVVADSCYSGRLVRGAKVQLASPDYYKKMSRKKARVAITSGGLEPVADSAGGAHSPFAAAFLKALNENDGVLDGTRLFEQIRRPVMVNANQTPQYSDVRKAGHDGGDFLLVRRR